MVNVLNKDPWILVRTLCQVDQSTLGLATTVPAMGLSLYVMLADDTPTLASQLGDKDRYGKDDRCQEVGAAEVDAGMVNGTVVVEEKNRNRGNKGKNREERGPQLTQNFELKGEQARAGSEDRKEALSTTGPTNKKMRKERDRYQMVGCNINGPDPKWKVYSRNR